MNGLGWKGVVAGLVVGLGVGGSIAYAAIPDSTTGTITACYPTSGTSKGALRVIDYQSGARCKVGEAMMSWPSRGFRWRGAWTGTVAYGVNDVVRYNGSAYVALKPGTNIMPTNTTFWSLMTSKGDTGATGPQGADAPPITGRVIALPDTDISLARNATYTTSTPVDTSGCAQVSAHFTVTDGIDAATGAVLVTYITANGSPIDSHAGTLSGYSENASVYFSDYNSPGWHPGPFSALAIAYNAPVGTPPETIGSIWLYCIPRG